MVEVVHRRGVFLPGAGLWLDPRDSAPLAFVSHAHSDHTGRHEATIATPVTLRLMEARMGPLPGAKVPLDFGEERAFEKFTIRLLPAGHVLGSAQCHVRTEDGDLLYTGDFKLRQGRSCEPAGTCHAGTLVMETTYGLPRYVFPPAEEVIERIAGFCLETIEDGLVPVLLGYSLGKAQEILSTLCDRGLRAMLHPSVARLAEIYAAEGIRFPETVPWDPAKSAGTVVICPPSSTQALLRFPRRRVAAVTGWAMDPGAVHRMRCDAAFPLSDHAGFDDLIRHVETVKPSRVLTLHGYAAEFARELRSRGIEAWALTGPNQLELSIAVGATEDRSEPAVTEVAQADDGLLKLADVGDRVAGLSGRKAKTQVLAEYFRELDEESLHHAPRWLAGRVFAAGDDAPHGAGWSVIKQALRAASGWNENDFRATSRRLNDAGLTAGEVMRGRGGPENPSLLGAAGFLAALRDARGPSAKISMLSALFSKIPPRATRYLVKILTGDLRTGVKEGLIEDALAAAFECEPAALREANMLLGDLGETAVLARAGRLAKAELRLFRPVKCMLASPEPDARAVWDHFEGRLVLEFKFDGIRAQLHSQGSRCRIFSRDLHEITATFPEIAAAQLPAGTVLDGEILAWAGDRPASFFELQKRLGRSGADLFLGSEIPVVFVAFDILQSRGRTLLREPLARRREELESLALAEPLRTVANRVPHSAVEIDQAFQEARAAGHEGLIAKDPASAYLPGRRGGAWVKLKKQFATLDVVVTAVEYGHGRRRDVLSDYTFAVRDESTGHLVTIGKAYSGLTDAEIAKLTTHFLGKERARSGNRIEVEPDTVLEIAFDSIQPSKRHASGLAMRFPRIVRIRSDKTAAEIDTLAAARRLVPREVRDDGEPA